jgi:cytochrome c oxidase subunit 4
MSTGAEHVPAGHAPGHENEHFVDPHDAHAEHKSDGYYVIVALILAVITALETSTYWIDFGAIFMPLLLILMTIKFVMVVSLFMHLKFDNRIFSYLFYSGLLLAVFVYVAALATFRFFGSG